MRERHLRQPTAFIQHRGCTQRKGEMPQFQLRGGAQREVGRRTLANTCFYWQKEKLKLSPATDLRDSSRPALGSTFIPIEALQHTASPGRG